MLYHFINIWEFILHQNSSVQRPRTFWLFKQVKLFSKYFNISINLDNFAQKIFSNRLTPELNLSSVMAPKFGATNTAKKIEKVHIKFCKKYACLHQNTADYFVLSECERYPLAITYILGQKRNAAYKAYIVYGGSFTNLSQTMCQFER